MDGDSDLEARDKERYIEAIDKKVERGERLPGTSVDTSTTVEASYMIVERLERLLTDVQRQKAKVIQQLAEVRRMNGSGANEIVDDWAAAIVEEADQEVSRREIFQERIRLYRQDPLIFFREVTRFQPDDWQVKAARAIAEGRRLAVRSGQGVGKTAFEANVVLWFLACFPYPPCGLYSPDAPAAQRCVVGRDCKMDGKQPDTRSAPQLDKDPRLYAGL